jgi:hypothetical protein
MKFLSQYYPFLHTNIPKLYSIFFKRGAFKNINITLNNKTTTNNLKNKNLKVRQKLNRRIKIIVTSCESEARKRQVGGRKFEYT